MALAQHPELDVEQAYISRAYERLEAMREGADERLHDALSSGRVGTPSAVEEREIIVRTSLLRLEQLDIGPLSLVFGRIDRDRDRDHEANGSDADHTFYIGRLAVWGADQEPLVVDWRAPVAEPFYRATGRHPLGLRRRRHFLADGRTVVAIEDEHFDGKDGDGLGLSGTSALLAALEQSRTGRMRDIVATVQREQDEVIRAPLQGVLVVQGGPGTGKTAVALHRAAYLLYTYRFPLERQGVLVVGPNRLFLRYIEHVLPSLGESGVELASVDALVADVKVRGVESHAAARIKGDARMATFIGRAVHDRQRTLPQVAEIGFGAHRLQITPAISEAVIRVAKRRPGTHNSRRRVVETQLWRRLHAQYEELAARARRAGIGPGPEVSVEELGQTLRRRREVAAALERMWPVLTPHELLHDLFGAPALVKLASRGLLTAEEEHSLHRPRSTTVEQVEWTSPDIALLDEAAVHLGPRPKTEDLSRGYGHIVVDEAQDLSPMQLRMIARRSIAGSMTVVGDIGQATGHWAPGSWDEVIAHLPKRQGKVVELTVNYRTPAEIMDVAARVLAEVAPHVRQPESVRSTGAHPTVTEVAPAALPSEVARVAREYASTREGTVGVVCAPSMEADLADAFRSARITFGEATRRGLDEIITLVPVGVAKGLEFDFVVVVEPSRMAREAPQGLRALYVALTRATKRVTVVHAEHLPAAMSPTGWDSV